MSERALRHREGRLAGIQKMACAAAQHPKLSGAWRTGHCPCPMTLCQSSRSPHATHRTLYALLIVQPVVGQVATYTHGTAIATFACGSIVLGRDDRVGWRRRSPTNCFPPASALVLHGFYKVNNYRYFSPSMLAIVYCRSPKAVLFLGTDLGTRRNGWQAHGAEGSNCKGREI
jgi:hypothetical protein